MKKYIKSASSVELTDQQIKEAISKHVLHMQDHAAENAIRKILFSDENIINWQNAWAAVKYNMPEMTKYRPESVEGASLPSDEDDFGPGEHIPIPIEKVKKGDEVSMEADLRSKEENERTLRFAVNGKVQKYCFTGLPEMIRFGV